MTIITPDMSHDEIAEQYRAAGLAILHLSAITQWTIPDILAACWGSPELLAEGYKEAMEDALCRFRPPGAVEQ